MALLWNKKKRRVIVVGLDGTPYSFIRKMTTRGLMPHFAQLLGHGSLRPMRSSYPYVSGVAWTSFMTGKNPGKHGIFGFVEREADSYRTYIPTSRHVRTATLPQILSQAGKRVCVLGVPMSYPPLAVNGVMVGCFLSPSLEKATYPPDLLGALKQRGYKVDTDPWAARNSADDFLKDFRATFAARAQTVLHLLDAEPWDFFIAHVIDTDRLHHFLWSCYEDADSPHHESFLECYRQVDAFLGQLYSRLSDRDELIIVSDHGSCELRKEVFLNYWLREQGYLKMANGNGNSLEDIDSSSFAYSLDPGRIYLNLRGREPRGCVEPNGQRDRLLNELAAGLLKLRDPETGMPMVEDVLRGNEIYSGPCARYGPDLMVMSAPGFDMKGSMNPESLTSDSALKGMHTFADAFLYMRGREIIPDHPSIMDVMPTMLELLGLPVPHDVDGEVCLQ